MKVKNKLGNVSYESNDVTKELKEKFETLLTEKLGDIIFYAAPGKNHEVDEIEAFGDYGFAFAISKFEDAFKEDCEGGFRYKHDEVILALKEIEKELELNVSVEWDRGFGVFVYNFFIK